MGRSAKNCIRAPIFGRLGIPSAADLCYAEKKRVLPRAKSLGFNGTPRTVGYVCSLIGLILGVLVCLLLVWLGAWSIGVFITLVERCL